MTAQQWWHDLPAPHELRPVRSGEAVDVDAILARHAIAEAEARATRVERREREHAALAMARVEAALLVIAVAGIGTAVITAFSGLISRLIGGVL